MNRRKGPPKRNSIIRDLRRGERIVQHFIKVLDVTREWLIRCLEALTVEVVILLAIRFSLFAGATGIAVIFTR